MYPSKTDAVEPAEAQPTGIPPFLLPHFARIAHDEGLAADYRLEYEQGAKPGDGFMSDLFAITLVGRRRDADNGGDSSSSSSSSSDLPLRVALVCKVQPLNAVRKEQLNSVAMFEREVLFYQRFYPLVERLQRDHGLTAATGGGFFAVPRCYVAAVEADDAYIIMQDLRSLGFRMWPKQRTVTVEHARLLLQQLGRLHGLSFVLRDQRPAEYAELVTGMPDLYGRIIYQNSARSMFDSTFRRAERLLERPRDKRLMRRLRDNWQRLMTECLDVRTMGEHVVLGHSDCWNNNMLFRSAAADGDSVGEGDGDWPPTEVCLVDWQFARPMSPADDFVMYMCSTLEKPLRDAHYDELVRVYYDSLAELVRRCGSDPERLFRYEDFVRSLGGGGRGGDYGVLEAALTVSIMVADEDNVADIDAMAANAGRAAGEEETGHFVHFNERTEAVYRRRLAETLDDARQRGWFSFDVAEEEEGDGEDVKEK